jgi:ferredoxin
MKKIRIDYYTGTGGAKLVAEQLAENLTHSAINVEVHRIIRNNIKDTEELHCVDYYVLIFPIHSFNAPKPIYEWIAHLKGSGCKTAVISVSGWGNAISNTASQWKTVKLLKKNNFNVIYEEMVQMPNNWMTVPNQKKCFRILSKIPTMIDKITQIVISEKKVKRVIYWIDYLISALGEAEKKGTHKFGKGIKVLDSCTGCALCSKNCCSSNIQMQKYAPTDLYPKPTFENRCDMCLGCIYNCPQKALQPTYGAFQIDKKGYDLMQYIK